MHEQPTQPSALRSVAQELLRFGCSVTIVHLHAKQSQENAMNSMPLEFRTSFKVVVGAVGFATAVVCFFLLRSAVPTSETGLQVALYLLFIGAIAGFDRLLTRFLPLLLLRLWPQLESTKSKA
jgi:hypothetical protein